MPSTPLWPGVASDVCAEVGLLLTDLDTAQLAMVDGKIDGAVAKVTEYLNRPLVAQTVTITDLYPMTEFDLTDYRAWPDVMYRWDDRYDVSAYVAAASGTEGAYDVTFKVGLDVGNTDNPEYAGIRRFIVIDAAMALAYDVRFKAIERTIKNVRAGGQSVTFDAPATLMSAGGNMTLESLKRWRRQSVYQRPSSPFPPWPYTWDRGGYYGSRY